MNRRNPLIVALDVENRASALRLVEQCGELIPFYKVGLELFTAEGPALVRELVGAGKQVFLDLKMYDIGETVRRAAARAADLGVSLLTVHCVPQVIRAAVEGVEGSQTKILAVTVLTSFDQRDLEDIGIAGRTPAEHVLWLAGRGLEAGTHGFVCSPLEAARLRALVGGGRLLVTPGVRSAGAAAHDQKRVATPAEALAAGADYLVIGREITRATDPRAAAQRILGEVADGC
ncbi:MAG: orotidine-5'-phosphate decarboxylase [Bryobacteraceae bacterium]|nr:orotidine-5'-phosphate decarboxylase [Bryobacteraceae bacterium]